MKRFYTLCLLSFAALHLLAQSYDQLWQRVEVAQNKDLPQTAMRTVQRIRTKAAQEQNVAQLIRATISLGSLQYEISPDSARSTLADMHSNIRKTKNTVHRALWQNATGLWMTTHRNHTDTARLYRGRQLIVASLADMPLLARSKVKDYAPLFEQGAASRAVYHDDLLDPLMLATQELSDKQQRQLLAQAVQTYEVQKRPRAALHMALRLVEVLPQKEQRAHLERLRQQYIALQDNAETYARLVDLHTSPDSAFALAKDGLARYGKKAAAELYNYVQQQEAPSLQLSWQHPRIKSAHITFYPGTTYHALLHYNNLRSVELRLHRFANIDAQDARLYDRYRSLVSDYSDLTTLLRQLPHQEVARATRSFAAAAPELRRRDSLAVQFPSAGVYMLELFIDGRREHLSLAFASTAYPLDALLRSASVATSQRHWMDLRTGAPLTAPTDAVYWPKAWPKEDVRFGPFVHEKEKREVHCRLFTDRAIYRPGQKIDISGIVFAQTGDHTTAQKGWKGTIFIKNVGDNDHSTLDSLRVESDEMGAFSTHYTLPKHRRLHRLLLETELKGESTYVYVEEYKRPTFEVKLEEIPEKAELSDTLLLQGKVVAHNGVPLPEVQVRTLVEGSPRWSKAHQWEITQRDTLLTDAEGRFTLKVNTQKIAKYGKAYWLNIEAEALADNGELQQTRLSHTYNNDKTPWNDDTEAKGLLSIITNKEQTVATLRISSPCHLLLMLLGDKGGILEERVVEVKDSLNLQYTWEERMGDGAQILAAFVKEGKQVHASAQLRRPDPDKRLLLSWRTFRSTLIPGQSEEWTLRVTHPDGSPARANVMARLYDAALDAFVRRDWEFAINYSRLLPQGWWKQYTFYAPYLNYAQHVQSLSPPRWQWTGWNTAMFDYANDTAMPYQQLMAGGLRLVTMDAVEEGESYNIRGAVQLGKRSNELSMPKMSALSLRRNFQETAFFFPRLPTDDKGEVTLRFSLPEQLTGWTFSALATDKEMNYGLLHERIVARKLLTTQTTLPRFVREGDRLTIPCRVHNTDSLPNKGRLRCTLTDAKSGKKVAQFDEKFNLAAGRTQNFDFAYAVPDGQSELIVKVVAESQQHSDGEEHRLPVLSRFITLTHAQPFIVRNGEDYAQKAKTARQQLLAQLEKGVSATISVDSCKDAHEEVRKVLPQLLKTQGESAYDWACTLYTLELAKHLQNHLALNQEEWEAQRSLAEEKLQAKIEKDGWPWYPGMSPSARITSRIVQLLARLRHLTGNTRYDYLLLPAMDFLGGEMADDVRNMKKMGHQAYLSDWHCRYLYSCRLIDKAYTPSAQYLLDLMPKLRKDFTMYGKSGVAVLLAGTSHDDEAQLALQSLVEHTVQSEEMGRYFDTQRAFGGWSSYRIPTQTFAIEALGHLKNKDDKVAGLPQSQLLDEMKLWLLQSKRTQQWNSSSSTADAVFALLAHPDASNKGLTWGAVSAQYQLPASEAIAKGKELRIARRLQVQVGKTWRDAQAQEVLQVGQHVRWVYDLEATRDFDHVALHSTRPACFETLRPLSGIAWTGSLPHYRWVRDTQNEYFIEHLAKGQYSLTDEMVVTLAGRYDAGLATIEAVFAPEFRANSNPLIFNTKR